MYTIIQLQQRNPLLFGYTCFCILACIICFICIQTTNIQVNNSNAFVKPAKFYASVAIFCSTMAWLLPYLQQPTSTQKYSWAVVIVMTIELAIITWQAAHGRRSHFNTSTPLYGILFGIMGIAISLLTLYTAYIGLLFFQLNNSSLALAYLWGIRLGILLFVIFSFQGGIMGARLAHTVGAADGTPGLPLVNWSKHHGDLRVAHFFGIHALQLLPLLGYWLGKHVYSLWAFAIAYAIWVSYTLIKAMKGLAFI